MKCEVLDKKSEKQLTLADLEPGDVFFFGLVYQEGTFLCMKLSPDKNRVSSNTDKPYTYVYLHNGVLGVSDHWNVTLLKGKFVGDPNQK